MLVRTKSQSDGECYGKTPRWAFDNCCQAMADGHESDECGTYGCPFYKPRGCEDWVRIDHGEVIHLYEPEELMEGGIYGNTERSN